MYRFPPRFCIVEQVVVFSICRFRVLAVFFFKQYHCVGWLLRGQPILWPSLDRSLLLGGRFFLNGSCPPFYFLLYTVVSMLLHVRIKPTCHIVYIVPTQLKTRMTLGLLFLAATQLSFRHAMPIQSTNFWFDSGTCSSPEFDLLFDELT